MASGQLVTLDTMVDTLKAAAESSRLRILALISSGDLTVTDLTDILNQSQPRVSRHLKVLLDAGLIQRKPRGTRNCYIVQHDRLAALGDAYSGMIAGFSPAPSKLEAEPA